MNECYGKPLYLGINQKSGLVRKTLIEENKLWRNRQYFLAKVFQ